jgi:hypothetical protein
LAIFTFFKTNMSCVSALHDAIQNYKVTISNHFPDIDGHIQRPKLNQNGHQLHNFKQIIVNLSSLHYALMLNFKI